MLAGKLNWAVPAALASLVLLAILAFAAVDRVSANPCGAKCRNDYNQCRISTKGSTSCEAAFTRCMQSCIRR